MSGVIEAAGLSLLEAQRFVECAPKVVMERWSAQDALVKICDAVRAELKALPIMSGDVVTIPFALGDPFTVLCVHDDEAWVLDVKSGGRLTVKLDCIERVQP